MSEKDWEELKQDLKDDKYVEEFLSAALAMIFKKADEDEA